MPVITYRKALNDALAEELARDENVFIIGEEVAQYNGAYKVTEGLWQRFGDKLVLYTPITEAAFVGLSIGASMLGLRPVVELMFWSFAFVAYDQIVNNAGCILTCRADRFICPWSSAVRPTAVPTWAPPIHTPRKAFSRTTPA